MDIEEIKAWEVINPRKFYWKDRVLVNGNAGVIGQHTSLHNVIGSCERSYKVLFENGENEWIAEDKIKLDK